MVLAGYTHRLDGNLSAAQIIDPALAAVGDPALLAAHCLQAADPALAERVREGDMLVVEGAVSGGAGAEAAVIAMQALGLAGLICQAADDDLVAAAAAYGLALLQSPPAAATIGAGELARIDLERGALEAGGRRWAFSPADQPAIAAVRRAQLLARMRRVVDDEGYAE
jgi:3-isopropylmalate/(R)-2-methylmalate dehydratase small subunit